MLAVINLCSLEPKHIRNTRDTKQATVKLLYMHVCVLTRLPQGQIPVLGEMCVGIKQHVPENRHCPSVPQTGFKISHNTWQLL